MQILTLLAVAYARPDVSLGYNYDHAASHHAYSHGLAPPHVAAPSQQYQQAASVPAPHIAVPHQNHEEAPRHQAPIISKHFYLHSAPEDHDSASKNKHFVLGRSQKNYRVIFIKAPSDGNAKTRLSAEYAPQEEKTVIYVLSQKEHELDVNDIATPAPTQPSKPEVFFVKYKTPEEAAHAQKEIQRQYDVLGGQSQVSDEGTAPVSSVIGSLGQGSLSAASNSHGSVAYLPPSHY